MSQLICKECSSPMHLASKMTSGNSTYETWQCDECMWRKMVCKGVR